MSFLKKVITAIFLIIHSIEIFAGSIILDPNSKHNTKLDKAGNGVPIVNISTPNNRGISINEFLDYNVDKRGQVLNNADNTGRSHLAGLINANPNLGANQAANLILLQVNGSNRSQIEGYLEALSREKVNVILSNENGIYINEAGTINIKNFTATTGKVKLKDGDFIGIDVNKGHVAIGPKGMDLTNANYVEIISKTLELTGNLVSKGDLKVVTGANKVDKNGNIEKIKSSSPAAVAIDASNLGGMYANTIKIISTDKGAGVNSDAFIVSKNSKLEITADGKVKVNKVQGKGIAVEAKDYEQKELAYSEEDIKIKADNIKLDGKLTQAEKAIILDGNVENNAELYTKENLKTKKLINTGDIEAQDKIEVDGNLVNSGNIKTNKSLKAKDVENTKNILVEDNINIGKLENLGLIATNKELAIEGSLKNSGKVHAIEKIEVESNAENTGEILTNSSFTAKDVINTKKLIAKEKIDITKLDNSGTVVTDKNLHIDGSLKNSGKIHAIEKIEVKSNANNTGEILTNSTFTAKDVINTEKLIAKEKIDIAKLDNSGTLATDKNLHIDGSLKNSGKIQAIEKIEVKLNANNTGEILTNSSFTARDVKNTKKLIAKEKIDIEKLDNSGIVATDKKLNIDGTLINSGDIQALDNITVVSDTENTGNILTNKSFSTKNLKNKNKLIAKENITSENLENEGSLAAGEKIDVKGTFINKKSVESKNLTVVGNKLENSGNIKVEELNAKVKTSKNDGKILALDSIKLETESLVNTNEIAALNNITADNTNVINSGDILSNGKISLNNASITNTKKIASNVIEMKDNKKFDNTGSIIGESVELLSENDINLVGELHGNQSLIIKGENIENNGKTTGNGLIAITSNDFSSNKDLSSKTLEINAKGDIKNNAIISGETVNVEGKNITNNDLVLAANKLTMTAEEKVENKKGKTVFSGNELNIKAKEILNHEGEIIGGNVELKAKYIRNEVGLLQALNNMHIKTSKFENIGRVTDLDKYESYYETWDGKIIEANEIENWKRWHSRGDSKRSDGDAGDYIRDRQEEAFNEFSTRVKNDKYASLLFPKYEALMRSYLGNKGHFTEKTKSARIPTIPLKEKLRSLGETEHAKVIAGNDIIIESETGGKSDEIINKDSIISAGNTVNIKTNRLENIVSTGEKVKVKTGQETMFIKFERTGKWPRKKVRMEVTYSRDFAQDYITKRVPRLDENGKQVYEEYGSDERPRRRKVYDIVTEYVGRYGYVTGQPSVIEGRNVVIDSTVIVPQAIEEANGLIKNGLAGNRLENKNIDIKNGINKSNSNLVINSNSSIEDLKNQNIDIEVYANLKKMEEVLKNSSISIDPNLNSALFIKNVSPSSKYLMETRAKHINISSFYGSDYFLSRIGYEEKWDRVRRLGDAFYENQLINKNIHEKLGTAFINGKSNQELVKSLIDNAKAEAGALNLKIGEELSAEQIKNLKKDIIWYVQQNVNGVDVLAPKIYLAKNTLDNLALDSRSKIAGTELTSIKTEDLVNTGAKIGNTGTTYVEAKSITNRSLTDQLSEITGTNTYLIADKDIKNIGGRIRGTELATVISKDGNILNQSTVIERNSEFSELNRTRHSEIKDIAEISSDGVLNIIGNNYTSVAGITKAKDLNINVKEDVNISSQKLSGEQKFGKDGDNFNSYAFESNIGSNVEAEKLNISAKNLNIKGSAVLAKDAILDVEKVKVDSNVDKIDTESRSKEKGFLKSHSKKELEHREENAAGTLYVENKAVMKGDVEVIGSNLALGKNSYIGGELKTDSKATYNKYIFEEKKKGLSSNLSLTNFSLSYGKNEFNYDERDKTNIKSNLILGDGTVLNKGANITATNFTHGDIAINNGDVIYGARKDEKDIRTSSKSSSFGLSINISSPALDRARQARNAVKQIGNGDKLGGLVNVGNALTGTVAGLAGNQGNKQAANNGAARSKSEIDSAKANNDFYFGIGANLGFNKSKQESESHTERAIVTTITAKDENSKIRYNNNKNIVYEGTEANNTTFVYNNVENIRKEAVELNNYYRSKGSSKGVGLSANLSLSPDLNKGAAGGNTNYGANSTSVSINASTSKSNSNTDETIYKNGRFTDVNEIHNNTDTMKLSGFNQEGGKVTGNIKNLVIESKQNTSTTTGGSKSGSIGISSNLVPTGSISASKTNGDRAFVDNQTSFIVAKDSNLKIENAENTASIIGTVDNGKIAIENYIGKNIANSENFTTKGASVGTSGLGINYSDLEKERIARNTVVGNVSIDKSSGDKINTDLSKANEITKNESTKTDIYAEKQLIEAIAKPDEFKEKLDKARQELKDIKNVLVNTINNKGKDNRNFIELLNEQRRNTAINNLLENDIKNILENSNDVQKDFSKLIENFGKDLGIDVEVIYADSANMPKESKQSIGSAFIDKETGKTTIAINTDEIKTTSELIGTVFEEFSHILGGIADRQD
ncbi:filamentous hemagglutinin N-terminal domain-containing protein, partial [Fusobacterium sp.]|uniref:two-partner secretion domain-containing protein n=1 Tax=Fusobacterium sp. TaxID=68766 RepID=UPI0034C6A665